MGGEREKNAAVKEKRPPPPPTTLFSLPFPFSLSLSLSPPSRFPPRRWYARRASISFLEALLQFIVVFGTCTEKERQFRKQFFFF